MDTLEQNIQKAADTMPPKWALRIDVENGWGGVTAILPDGTEIDMDDGANCLAEQVAAVILMSGQPEEPKPK